MRSSIVWKIIGGVAATALLASALSSVAVPRAEAVQPGSPSSARALESSLPVEAFTADACAGPTDLPPTENIGFAVPNLLQMFGARLTSFNDGRVVPLYDSYGASSLLDSAGELTDPDADMTAYPPICGTRFVAASGGQGLAVSEWMYCTDRTAQTCGDTDAMGNVVDHDGNPVAPLSNLDVNPKLSADQEKIIAYLVQHGFPYAGVGNQAWGGVTEARSELGTQSRNALQTLIWCISDPMVEPSDFASTCESNMNAGVQAEILAMIPDSPQLVLAFEGSEAVLTAGSTARFALTTNVFNQPIQLTTGGSLADDLTVCEGTAVLDGSTLTVSGTNPNVPMEVVLCATSSVAGTVSVRASAEPAAVSHIGWAQSINPDLETPCQVYATFHAAQQSMVGSEASARFITKTVQPTAPHRVDTGANG